MKNAKDILLIAVVVWLIAENILHVPVLATMQSLTTGQVAVPAVQASGVLSVARDVAGYSPEAQARRQPHQTLDQAACDFGGKYNPDSPCLAANRRSTALDILDDVMGR